MTLPAEKRLVYEDRVQVPRLYLQWPTVGENNDDRFALDVLGRDPELVRARRASPRRCVYDQQAAAAVERDPVHERRRRRIRVIASRRGPATRSRISKPRPMRSSKS